MVIQLCVAGGDVFFCPIAMTAGLQNLDGASVLQTRAGDA